MMTIYSTHFCESSKSTSRVEENLSPENTKKEKNFCGSFFLSEPQDSKDLGPFNRLTENAEEADPVESAEILNAISKLETDDLAITSVEQICLKKRPAGEALKYKGYSGTVENHLRLREQIGKAPEMRS